MLHIDVCIKIIVLLESVQFGKTKLVNSLLQVDSLIIWQGLSI